MTSFCPVETIENQTCKSRSVKQSFESFFAGDLRRTDGHPHGADRFARTGRGARSRGDPSCPPTLSTQMQPEVSGPTAAARRPRRPEAQGPPAGPGDRTAGPPPPGRPRARRPPATRARPRSRKINSASVRVTSTTAGGGCPCARPRLMPFLLKPAGHHFGTALGDQTADFTQFGRPEAPIERKRQIIQPDFAFAAGLEHVRASARRGRSCKS